MSVIAAFATPENLQFLITTKAFIMIIGMMGVLGMAVWMASATSMRGSPPNIIGLLGLAAFTSSVLLSGMCQTAIDDINTNRPFNITPASSFDHSRFQPIASLKDNSITNGISGSGTFILGCGNMKVSGGDTIPVYTFYKRMPENEFVQDSIPSANVYIKEDGTGDPKIEWIYHYTIAEKKTYTDNGETLGGSETDTLTKTIIHVPVGAIVKDYKLDSEV